MNFHWFLKASKAKLVLLPHHTSGLSLLLAKNSQFQQILITKLMRKCHLIKQDENLLGVVYISGQHICNCQ